MKISTFKAQSNISETLIDAVLKQLGGTESFKESAIDIANHGIDGGFHGFIYYKDTVKFARKHRKAIMDYAEEMAKEFGQSGALEMIAGFNCLNGNYSQSEIAEAIYNDSDNSEQVLNALAWFIAEEVARAYSDACEN